MLTLTAAVCGLFIWGTNPVHGVLTLVAAGLLLAAGLLRQNLEFSALIVVLVYVGAVTVLFVFVVMMVNLRVTPTGYTTVEAGVVTAGLGWSAWHTGVLPTITFPSEVQLLQLIGLPGLGHTLYATPTVGVVVVVGLILWLAMVSAICLSLTNGENYRTQEFYSQIRKSNAVFILHHD